MSDRDYRKLLDALEDAVVIGDRSGSIVYASPAVEKLLGWEREELIGRPLTALIPHKLRSRHTAGFNRTRSTRQHRVLGQPLRLPVLRADGTERVLEMVLSAYRGGAGEELFIATFRRPSSSQERESSASRGYLRGLKIIAEQLRRDEDPVGLARQLEVLASAHLGAVGVRLWLTAGPNELRLVNRRPVAELGEPTEGTLNLFAESSPVAEAARTHLLVVNPPREDSRGWLDQQGIAVTAAVPLKEGEELLGVLHLLSGDSWSEELAQALTLLGGLVSSTLIAGGIREREERLRTTASLLDGLTELIDQVARMSPYDEVRPVLTSLVEWALRASGGEQGGLVLLGSSTGAGVVTACAGYKTAITGMTVPQGIGVTAIVVDTGSAVLIPDYQRMDNPIPGIRQRGTRAAMGVPVNGRAGVLGVLALGMKRRDASFSEEELRRAMPFATLAAVLLGPNH